MPKKSKIYSWLSMFDPRYDTYVVMGFATLIFWVQALAWPLGPGRDCLGYFAYFYDFNQLNPYDWLFMILRTPLPSFFFTPLLEHLGGAWVEAIMYVFFVMSIVLFFYAVKVWNRKVAYIVTVILLLQFGWGALAHVVSSDSLTALLAINFFSALIFATNLQRYYLFGLTGIIGGLLFFSRPANQLFFIFALVPLILSKFKISKFLSIVCFVIGMAPFLLGWAWHNQTQYGTFTISRASYLINPIWRLWIVDQLVKPENGPASRALADAVEENILKGKGTAKEYFADPGYAGKIPELMPLIDKMWGKKSNYKILLDVSLEAIGKHPFKYSYGVLRTFVMTMVPNYKHPVPLRGGASVFTNKSTVAYVGDNLKDNFDPIYSTDLKHIANSSLYGPYLHKMHPSIGRAYDLQMKEIPPRSGKIFAGRILNLLAQFFIPMPVFIFLFFVGLWKTRQWTNENRILFFLVLFGLGHILMGCMSIHTSVYQYRLYFDPVFILSGVLGFRWLFPNRIS